MTMTTLQRNILKCVLPQKNNFWLQLLKSIKIFQILEKKWKNQRTKYQNFQKSKKLIKKKMIQSKEIIEKKIHDYTIEKYKR